MIQRVAIVGNCASGKTTLARKVASRTGAEHIEIDAYFHQPGWTPADRATIRAEISAVLEDSQGRDGWVADGNYDSTVGDMIRERAATIIVFDLARSLVMRRVIRRTLKRAFTREILWNGNREPLTNFYRWNPEQNIIRWTWVKHDEYRRRYHECMADGTWDHANVVVCKTPDDADAWLASLPEQMPR